MINGQANKTRFFSILLQLLMVIAEYEKKHEEQ